MAKIKRFTVTLFPAHRSSRNPNIIGFAMAIGGSAEPRKTFDAASTSEVLAIVRAFAEEHGEACHPSVRCLDTPKPAGFDKQLHGLYFNMEKAPLR